MWYRQQPVPAFAATSKDGCLIIKPRLRADVCRQPAATPDSLAIRVKATERCWHPSDVDTDNLKTA
ncbi:MAG: hypothetical protein IPK17_00440 [Chloroflexi bacterium]|uniref:hypothetical protein n=1 Tax=Candidatus Flexifilum breve TaxID=3140694 RepID=UPI0031370C4B|nr:hypothetical protein [Chloroflexota bacterium]